MAAEQDKAVDFLLRLGENGSKIADTFTKAGVAYLGYKVSNHWTGALSALIALRLATGGNLAGGVAGVGVLAGIGLSQIIPRTGKAPAELYPLENLVYDYGLGQWVPRP